MPSKHNPPSDSSSSSEEEEEEEEEEEVVVVKASQEDEEEDDDDEEEEEEEEEPQPTPKPTSNSTPHKPIPPSNEGDESDDDEEEEEEDPTPPPPLKPSKPNPTSNSTPQPKPNESDSDSDESDTDSPTPTKTPAPLDIKPISSKPMPSSSTSTKPIVMGLASTTKRPAETDSRKDKNKKKKKVSDLVDDQNDQNKKNNMFQRIWSEEDEIVILKGLINFKKKGMDISIDTIKDSLHTKDVTNTQVHSKIRALKKRFQNAAKKPKPGENLKPHDAKLYQLSKKIWNEEEEEDGKDDKKKKKKSKSESGSGSGSGSKKLPDTVVAASPTPKVTTLPNNTTKELVKDEDKKNGLEYLYLSESSIAPKFPMMPVPPLGLGDIIWKRGWDVIGISKAQKFDQKWKNVIIAETKAYLQRLDLVKEQTQAMLDALESSDV